MRWNHQQTSLTGALRAGLLEFTVPDGTRRSGTPQDSPRFGQRDNPYLAAHQPVSERRFLKAIPSRGWARPWPWHSADEASASWGDPARGCQRGRTGAAGQEGAAPGWFRADGCPCRGAHNTARAAKGSATTHSFFRSASGVIHRATYAGVDRITCAAILVGSNIARSPDSSDARIVVAQAQPEGRARRGRGP